MQAIARTKNLTLYNNNQPINLLITDQGGIPMNYPSDTIDLLHLPASNVKDLLKAYGLPIDNNKNDYSQKQN